MPNPRSAGTMTYQSYKGVDGVFHEQGDPGLAHFLFAWRTPQTDGFDQTYQGYFEDGWGPG